MDIFNLKELPMKDESIESYEYHKYEPITGSSLNNFGEIRINIELQDIVTHPANSYIVFGGRLLKADGATYADTDVVTLSHNAMMYLFAMIKYQAGSQTIETLYNTGRATTMMGVLKYPADFSKSKGLNQMWMDDTAAIASLTANEGFKARHDYVIIQTNPKGSFQLKVPLEDIFGYCEDVMKISYGARQTLTLVRKSDDDAIYKNIATAEGKIELSEISWYMPHIIPSDTTRFKFYKMIEEKVTVPVAFRMRQCDVTSVPQSTSFSHRLGVKSSPERPRYIIIGFQTDKEGSQTVNSALFDHVNVTNMYVMLNAARYPAVDYDMSFAKNNFARMYGEAVNFREKFYGMDKLMSNPNISPSDYKSLYPLFVFDVSKQNDRIKPSITDIQIKAQFSENVPAGTQMYSLVISDRYIKFQSDGSKMSVIM